MKLSEGQKDTRFYTICKTLNKLVQQEIPENLSFSKDFCGKITVERTRYWNDFSWDDSLEIILFTNGNTKDINVNDCLFSYIIKGHEGRTNSYGYSHGLTIKGCWPNNEEFSFQFSISSNMDNLTAIIYAIIILSETKDLNVSSNLWRIISQAYYSKNVGERLQLILESKDSLSRISEKYPFMNRIIKDGLNYQIERVKEEINNLDFLKQ